MHPALENVRGRHARYASEHGRNSFEMVKLDALRLPGAAMSAYARWVCRKWSMWEEAGCPGDFDRWLERRKT